MNECEWKDGKLDTCDEFDGRLIKGLSRTISGETVPIFYCMHCNGDIMKPEEEKPLIVKSGGTWVYDAEGINYICTKPHIYSKSGTLTLNDFHSRILHWKSFTGYNPEITELTDELALLRPMVKATVKASQFMYILWGIKDDYGIFEHDDSISWINIKNCRLATAEELQEAL